MFLFICMRDNHLFQVNGHKGKSEISCAMIPIPNDICGEISILSDILTTIGDETRQLILLVLMTSKCKEGITCNCACYWVSGKKISKNGTMKKGCSRMDVNRILSEKSGVASLLRQAFFRNLCHCFIGAYRTGKQSTC